MASVSDMMEAECGPSNPLTDLARHLTEDLSRREEIAAHGVSGAGAEAPAGLSRPFPLHPAVMTNVWRMHVRSLMLVWMRGRYNIFGPFVRSFIRLFIHSFIYSFIRGKAYSIFCP